MLTVHTIGLIVLVMVRESLCPSHAPLTASDSRRARRLDASRSPQLRGVLAIATEDYTSAGRMGTTLAVMLWLGAGTAGFEFYEHLKLLSLQRVAEREMVGAWRGGALVRSHHSTVTVGDVILLEVGDIVPAHGVLLEGEVEVVSCTSEEDTAALPFLFRGATIVSAVGDGEQPRFPNTKGGRGLALESILQNVCVCVCVCVLTIA